MRTRRNTRRLSIRETIKSVQELQSRNIKNRTEELNEEIIRHQRLLRLFDKTEAESGIKRANVLEDKIVQTNVD